MNGEQIATGASALAMTLYGSSCTGASGMPRATGVCFAHNSNVGQGDVCAAADGTDERICTNLVVPAPARPVVAPYGETTIDGS